MTSCKEEEGGKAKCELGYKGVTKEGEGGGGEDIPLKPLWVKF